MQETLGSSDHNQIYFDIEVKSESKHKKKYRRNFHKGKYKKNIRKYLDWNKILRTKAVPLKNQRKQPKKNSVKQTMWRVYRRTRND